VLARGVERPGVVGRELDNERRLGVFVAVLLVLEDLIGLLLTPKVLVDLFKAERPGPELRFMF